MWIRKQIDIGFRDLLFGLKCTLFNFEYSEATESQLQSAWGPSDCEPVFMLSVRSGFDSLLQCVDWQPDSEILVSSLTIVDMPRIIAKHGFVPVGVDLERKTLAPSIDQLEQRLTSKTRAILVAHLFGNQIDLAQLATFARRHNLLLIEDCAQSYRPGECGSAFADVSMFSFGPIKSTTALGASIFEIRRPELRAAVVKQQKQLPVQSRFSLAKRILKYGAIKIASTRSTVRLLHSISRVFGVDFDKRVSVMARGFSGQGFFRRIREQPNPVLLALLSRRLTKQNKNSQFAIRSTKGQFLRSLLEPNVPVLNFPLGNVPSTYWVIPIEVENPNDVVQQLVLNGFDATRRSSLINVSWDNDSVVAGVLKRMVFLPFQEKMSTHTLETIAKVVLSSAVTANYVERPKLENETCPSKSDSQVVSAI